MKFNLHAKKSNKSSKDIEFNLHVNIVNGPPHILEDRLEGHVQVTRQEPILHPKQGFQ